MRSAIVLTLMTLASVTISAQEWTQWRGPTRDGMVTGSAVPTSWTATSTVWRVTVGEGYASPVLAGSRVIVHSRRDPEEVVTAVDLQTGKVMWQQAYPAVFAKNQYAVRMAKGPNSTPLVAGDSVFTLGVTGILSAWRASDGTLLWRKDYSATIDTSKLFCGTAASPLLEQGALIVQVGSDIHGGRILALDPATGSERWTWSGPGPGYASPLAIMAGGVRQIVTLTNQSVVGLDARSGAALWSIAFPDEWHENIVSPVWTGTHLVVSGIRQGTQAYTLTNSGGAWQARQVWKNADVTMYMSAPVVADGTLYGFSNKRKGQIVALDMANGTMRWSTEGRAGEHASILTTSSHVLFLTNNGELVVARKSATQFSEEKRLEVADDETWAVPAFIPGGLIVRHGQALTRLRWSDAPPARGQAAHTRQSTARSQTLR